jgi:hypothetical protein
MKEAIVKVKLLNGVACPEYSGSAGQVISITESEAASLIAGGYAEAAVEAAAEVESEAEVEAVVEAPPVAPPEPLQEGEKE